MSRSEAIQRIVWCLLRHANRPDVAVATAATMKAHLGKGYEQRMTFTNLLRAAGLFAKDDDGYFMRYHHSTVPADMTFLDMPDANYLLTLPVPVEPRMRIAYNVFTGLLLKYLYQTYGAVPTEVCEGMARLVADQPLPDSSALWEEFKRSDFVTNAVCEGLEATLGAIGGIGGIDVTETMANSALLRAFLKVLPRFENKFQSQGGMRLNYYLTDDIDKWLKKNQITGTSNESLEDLWKRAWQEDVSPAEVAKQIAVRVVSDIQRGQPLPARTFRALWTGEGSGDNRKPGVRDNLPKASDDKSQRARQVDEAVVGFLNQLDARRQNTRALHQWVSSVLNGSQYRTQLDEIVKKACDAISSSGKKRPDTRDTTSLLDSIVAEFRAQAIVPSLRKDVKRHDGEVRNAINETVRLCVAFHLARQLGSESCMPTSIFGWQVAT
ncbi:MAG: hypothetical protein QXS54_11615, partial [Candidatus Methanomethylicaceae archaeon]